MSRQLRKRYCHNTPRNRQDNCRTFHSCRTCHCRIQAGSHPCNWWNSHPSRKRRSCKPDKLHNPSCSSNTFHYCRIDHCHNMNRNHRGNCRTSHPSCTICHHKRTNNLADNTNSFPQDRRLRHRTGNPGRIRLSPSRPHMQHTNTPTHNKHPRKHTANSG